MLVLIARSGGCVFQRMGKAIWNAYNWHIFSTHLVIIVVFDIDVLDFDGRVVETCAEPGCLEDLVREDL
jgi:hypothetical protein